MLNQQCFQPVLTQIDSQIKPLLISVLSTDKFGTYRREIGVDSISSSCGKVKGDRFKLFIPYATQNLTWNVFFDSQCPELGPDFIFNDNTFLADTDVDTLSTKVPSLTKWNPNDKNALLNVLVELLTCYKQHQMQLFQKQDRLQSEYNTLMKSTEVKPEDVEMILLPFGTKPIEARFLISFPIDLSELQTRTCESKTDIAILNVTFSGTNWNHIVPQLQLSKSLESSLDNLAEFNLPHFPSNKFLIDYIAEVKRYITGKINSIIESLVNRRKFISAMLHINNNASIELDAVKFSYISVMLSTQGFNYTVHINLLPQFPTEKPVVTVISIYHMESIGTPYKEIIENFPYHKNWEPYIMVMKLLKHIDQHIENFISNSLKKCFSNYISV